MFTLHFTLLLFLCVVCEAQQSTKYQDENTVAGHCYILIFTTNPL